MTEKTFMEYHKLSLKLWTKVGQLLAIFQCMNESYQNQGNISLFLQVILTIFKKSFGLLQNLMRNCEILQQLTRSHKTNDISQNFSGITLGFREVSKYFVDFWFCFWYFRKVTPNFWFCSYRFEILKFKTWQWWKFKKSILQLPTLKELITNLKSSECSAQTKYWVIKIVTRYLFHITTKKRFYYNGLWQVCFPNKMRHAKMPNRYILIDKIPIQRLYF